MNLPSRKTRSEAPRSRGRPTAEGALDRDRIVEAVSWEIFSTLGYARATIDEISRRAGVAKRTLYAQYGGKVGLFERIVRPLSNPIPPAETFEACASAEETLSAAVRLSLLSERGERSAIVMRLLIAEGQTQSELMKDVQRSSRDLLIRNYTPLFTRLFERKLLEPVRGPAETAEMFVDLVVGAILIAQLSGATELNPSLVDDAVRVFVRGYPAVRA